MSTRGWFIFKYKGIYYVFYNQCDSYIDIPYGLCSRLIEELKKYNIEQLIELLENFILLINGEGGEGDEDDEDDEDDGDEKSKDIYYEGIEQTLTNKNYAYQIMNTTEEIHKKDIFIEYKYIINLDEELFTISDERKNIQLHYPLFNIPNDWYDFYCKVLDAYHSE